MKLRKPALGTVLGATALTVALVSTGGVAEAAKLINGKFIKANTVSTKQIKNGTIGAIDIAPGVLPTVGDGSITAAKLAAGSVTATKIGAITKRTSSVVIANGTGNFVQVTCLPGEKVIGGGSQTTGVGVDAGWNLIRSGPSGDGWDAAARNNIGASATLTAIVLCLQG